MIILDANVLLYAYDTSSPKHQVSLAFLERSLSGTEPVRLAWATVLAFLRIATHPRVFENPMSTEEATAVVASWLSQPIMGLIDPGERHWEILQGLLVDAQARGPLVSDAHLAALAIEYGATLCTTDRDFARFPGLDMRDPLSDE